MLQRRCSLDDDDDDDGEADALPAFGFVVSKNGKPLLAPPVSASNGGR